MDAWIHTLWKETWRGVSKVYLAVIILGVSICAMAALEAGDLAFWTTMNAQDVIINVVKTVTGSVPFPNIISDILGAVLDGWDVNANFAAAGGYGVMHDLSKSALLLIVLELCLGLLKPAWKLVSGSSGNTPLALFIRGYFDLFLAVCISLSCMIWTCIIHDVLLNCWLDTFGNGRISNTGYLIVMILLFIIVYLVVPVTRRESLVDTLAGMLINFGLVLCILTLLTYIGAVIGIATSGGAEPGWILLHIFLPMLLTGVGFSVLLAIRMRNKK